MPVPPEKQLEDPTEQGREQVPAAVTEINDSRDQEDSDALDADEAQPPLECIKSPQGKMFVGGISWQTSRDAMRNLFEKYGEVVECQIIQDPVTKRSRGFGFVTFRDQDSVRGVLDAHERQPLTLDHKKIDPKVAVSKRDGTRFHRNKKVFIGGVPSDATVADIINYFKQFGEVKDAQLMYDKETRRHRGFGFVTFEADHVVDEVCGIQYHDIRNKKVEVKEAIPKDAMMQKNGRGVNSLGYGMWSNQYLPYFHYPWTMMPGFTPYLYAMGRNTYRSRHRDPYIPGTTYYNTGYLSGDHTSSTNDYYSFPMTVCSPTEHTHTMTTSGVDYVTDSFQNMTLTTYGQSSHMPSGMYPGGPVSSNGSSYHNDTPTNNTMNGITSQSPLVNGYSGTGSAFTLVSSQQPQSTY